MDANWMRGSVWQRGDVASWAPPSGLEAQFGTTIAGHDRPDAPACFQKIQLPATVRATGRTLTLPDGGNAAMSDASASTMDANPTALPSVAWTGAVAHLHITARAFLPMRAQESIELVAGRGILGDRYMLGTEQGFYSEKPEEGRQITLFESEALEAIARDYKIELLPEEHRRNITTRGVPLNWLVGKRFRIGACLVEATRLSVPCRHIEQILDKQVFDPMVHRSGLNCRILVGGTVRIGDVIRPD
jgi:hypothetical protein